MYYNQYTVNSKHLNLNATKTYNFQKVFTSLKQRYIFKQHPQRVRKVSSQRPDSWEQLFNSSCAHATFLHFSREDNNGQLPVKGQQKPCTTMMLFEWCEENLPRIRMESSPTGKQVGDYSLLSLQRHCQAHVQQAYFLCNCMTGWGGGWWATVMPNCMLGFFIKHQSSI